MVDWEGLPTIQLVQPTQQLTHVNTHDALCDAGYWWVLLRLCPEHATAAAAMPAVVAGVDNTSATQRQKGTSLSC